MFDGSIPDDRGRRFGDPAAGRRAAARGGVEVTVRAVEKPAPAREDSMAATRDWLLRVAAEAEALDPDLPSDLAENHDHYAHGKPLPTQPNDSLTATQKWLLELAAQAERLNPDL